MTAQTNLFSQLSELQAKRDAKLLLGIMRRRDIERAASWARHIWRKKAKSKPPVDIQGHIVVCADEVRAAAKIEPVKDGRCNNWIGAVFTAKIPEKRKWALVPELGEHSSRIRGSHGNGQKYWSLTDEVWGK